MKTGDNDLYLVQCHNEWCDGPKTFKMLQEKPDHNEPYACPVCGWPAKLGSGIKRVGTQDI